MLYSSHLSSVLWRLCHINGGPLRLHDGTGGQVTKLLGGNLLSVSYWAAGL